MLNGSTFIYLLPHANRSSVEICDGLKSVLKCMQRRVFRGQIANCQHKHVS